MKNGTAFFHETGIQTDRIGSLGQYIATCTQAFWTAQTEWRSDSAH